MYKVVVGKMFCKLVDLDTVKRVKRQAKNIGIGTILVKGGKVHSTSRVDDVPQFLVSKRPMFNFLNMDGSHGLTWITEPADKYLDIEIKAPLEVKVGDKLPGVGRIEELRHDWTGNELVVSFKEGGFAVLASRVSYPVERMVQYLRVGDVLVGRGKVLRQGWEASGLGYGYVAQPDRAGAHPIFHEASEHSRVKVLTNDILPTDKFRDEENVYRTVGAVRYMKTVLENGGIPGYPMNFKVPEKRVIRVPAETIRYELWPHQKNLLDALAYAVPTPPTEWLVQISSGTRLRLFPGSAITARIRAGRVKQGDNMGYYEQGPIVKSIHDVSYAPDLVVFRTNSGNHLCRRDQEIIINNVTPDRLVKGDAIKTPGGHYDEIVSIDVPTVRTFGESDVIVRERGGKELRFHATKIEITGLPTGGEV